MLRSCGTSLSHKINGKNQNAPRTHLEARTLPRPRGSCSRGTLLNFRSRPLRLALETNPRMSNVSDLISR